MAHDTAKTGGEMKEVENKENGEIKEVEKSKVDSLIRHHMYSAFGIGLIPLPLLDIAALTGVQLNLIRKLANLYGVPFSKDKVKNILSSLLAGSIPPVAGIPAMSYAKIIPIVGYSLSAVSMSVIAAPCTYAIGKVFNQHFASGGTFLTFDESKVKDYYSKMFKKGKEVVSDMNLKRKPDNTADNKDKAGPKVKKTA